MESSGIKTLSSKAGISKVFGIYRNKTEQERFARFDEFKGRRLREVSLAHKRAEVSVYIKQSSGAPD